VPRWLLTFPILMGALVACRRDAAPRPLTKPTPTTTPAASLEASPPSAVASATATVAPESPPIPRSRTPTTAEWRSAAKLALSGADWTGCVAEGVREWVRVSCRGVGRPGLPVSILVTRGQSPDVMTYMKEGVTSLLFRFVPGTEFDALFAWNEPAEGDSPILPLEVRWPQGATFSSVPTSLSTHRREAECACYARYASMRDGLPERDAGASKGCSLHTFRFACLRTESGEDPDCATLIGCTSTPSPDVVVRCLPGEVHVFASPSAYCARVCGPDAPCPPGFLCTSDLGHDAERACLFDKAR
jgi:hypothetical protein